MSDTYYQLVCADHTPHAVLADILRSPDREASERYEQEMQRWDNHNSGDKLISDTYGRPLPRQFRPHMPRHSSRTITVLPREHMFIPELIDRDEPDIKTADDWMRLLRDLAEGKPMPHGGHVRTTTYRIGADENTDGHKIEITCELCKKLRSKPLRMPPTSADTLRIVLDRIGPDLATEKQPMYDLASGTLTGDTVDVRVITLRRLTKELGNSPRG